MKITELTAYEAMDARGTPTVAVLLTTPRGRFRAVVPAGASVGSHEAFELRDGGARLMGMGATKAVCNVNTVIRERLCGHSFATLAEIDDLLVRLDHTENKRLLGANATLAVSFAAARAFAAEANTELFALFGGEFLLPCPMLNLLNGGAHAQNNLDIQEFMILPIGARDFTEAMDIAREVFLRLKLLLKQNNLCTGVGDEGGFAPNLENDEQALALLTEAIDKAGASEVMLALDIAANEWYRGGVYRQPKSGKCFDRSALLAYYRSLVAQFPIISIEDAFAEDDRDGFRAMMQDFPIQIVGDDLFATNPKRIAAFSDCATALLVKPNQIGTVSETLSAMRVAEQHSLARILSHRSGDTEDAFIADLAVGTACGLIKTGAPTRGERTAKFNRLLEIAQLFPEAAQYSGKNALRTPLFGFFRQNDLTR